MPNDQRTEAHNKNKQYFIRPIYCQVPKQSKKLIHTFSLFYFIQFNI